MPVPADQPSPALPICENPAGSVEGGAGDIGDIFPQQRKINSKAGILLPAGLMQEPQDRPCDATIGALRRQLAQPLLCFAKACTDDREHVEGDV